MEKQILLINDYCRRLKRRGSTIFLDPIMSDDGKLYNGVTCQTVQYMRGLLQAADYSVPNYSEALIRRLIQAGAKSLAVTSAKVDGQDCVIVYDDVSKTLDYLPFEYIPVRFHSTGDIFSAIFIGNVLKALRATSEDFSPVNFARRLEKNYGGFQWLRYPC